MKPTIYPGQILQDTNTGSLLRVTTVDEQSITYSDKNAGRDKRATLAYVYHFIGSGFWRPISIKPVSRQAHRTHPKLSSQAK